MQTQFLVILFTASLLPGGGLAYYIGRAKAIRMRAQGVPMYAQPDQYGLFALLATIGPAAIIAALGFVLNLIGFDIFEGAVVVGAAIIFATGGLLLGFNSISPELHARKWNESFIGVLLFGATSISILTTFGILISVLFEAIRFFQQESFWYFITGTEWSPDTSFLSGAGRGGEGAEKANFGAVPLFAGTFMITFIALLVAVPIGLFAAVYMAEFAAPKVRDWAKPMLEVLAGIPTVVYGFFAAITVAPLIVDAAAVFGLEATYNNALASGVVMGIMIIPFISSLSDDVINAVPNAMREGSLALGTTKAETIKNIILPASTAGIISATLLGMSRALGETMIVVMAAGLRPNLTWNPLEDMTTVTVRIVDALVGDQAFDSAETLSAFALGLTLFFVTLVLNTISVIMIRRFREKYRSSNL